uniref:Histone-binding protein RBBP4 n=1 Tax=Tetraselmis sp. GSL018 TaxID=582737 RepID=A0A061SCG6_9CHLO
MEKSRKAPTLSASYKRWKTLVPYTYDWLAHHHTFWPSQSCRWGPKVEESNVRMRQLAYISEQTDGKEEKNTLQIVCCDIVKNRVASVESIATFDECMKSPLIKVQKTIYHPGEVNKIRELPQHPTIVVTHTDSPDLFVWDMARQPERAGDQSKEDSVPDMTLKGHTDTAQFALSCSSAAPMVASGGMDTNVVVWNLEDSILGSAGLRQRDGEALMAQSTLRGHENTVEDVCWQPGTANSIASVGDDSKLLLWDLRSPEPCGKVENAHGEATDIHCVDWSGADPHFLATGCANGVVRVWDTRMLGEVGASAVKSIAYHDKAVMRVEWSPSERSVVASSAEDQLVCVWRLDQEASEKDRMGSSARNAVGRTIPPELLFQHAGHRAPVVDFQWNPLDPWLMLSVSDDVGGGMAGGTLQVWRLNDMIYRDPQEVLAELEAHRDFILYGYDGPADKEAASNQA